MTQKGISPILIILIIVGVLAVTGGVYFYFYTQKFGQSICAKDSKICPDGTKVSRVLPVCDFAPCPAAEDETADWKIYRNEKYGFEVKYPAEFTISKTGDYIVIYTELGSEHPKEILPIIRFNLQNIDGESVFDSDEKNKINLATFATKKAQIYTCPIDNPCPTQFSYRKAIRIVDPPEPWGENNEINIDVKIGYENYKITADQILSTFKFTK